MPAIELADADRVLSGLADDLEGDSDRVADAMARAILEQAVQTAAGRPSPQSRMAASGFEVRDGTITGSGSVHGSGGSAAIEDVAGGSEWGSTVYRQFGPRSSGHWMTPAVREPSDEAKQAGDDQVERIVQASVQ